MWYDRERDLVRAGNSLRASGTFTWTGTEPAFIVQQAVDADTDPMHDGGTDSYVDAYAEMLRQGEAEYLGETTVGPVPAFRLRFPVWPDTPGETTVTVDVRRSDYLPIQLEWYSHGSSGIATSPCRVEFTLMEYVDRSAAGAAFRPPVAPAGPHNDEVWQRADEARRFEAFDIYWLGRTFGVDGRLLDGGRKPDLLRYQRFADDGVDRSPNRHFVRPSSWPRLQYKAEYLRDESPGWLVEVMSLPRVSRSRWEQLFVRDLSATTSRPTSIAGRSGLAVTRPSDTDPQESLHFLVLDAGRTTVVVCAPDESVVTSAAESLQRLE